MPDEKPTLEYGRQKPPRRWPWPLVVACRVFEVVAAMVGAIVLIRLVGPAVLRTFSSLWSR